MNKSAQFVGRFINSSTRVPRKLAALLLVFSFLVSPILPVFAQEATVPEQAADTAQEQVQEQAAPVITGQQSPAEEEVQSETIPVPDDTAATTETEKTKEEKDKDKKAGEEPEATASMLAGTTVPNSSREVLQGVRNRISTQIDNASGALIYTYPIVVPPGRNGLTPEVSLVYNSADANLDSIVGSGWALNIPSIQRLNKTGTNNLYSTDYYTSSLSGELVSLGANTYAAKVENGDFLTYTKNTNGWTVKDKSGTVYTFGLNVQARQDNSADTAKIYKWMLEEVRDTNNNYISYEYYKDAGQIYPSRIVYTGNGSTAGIFEVNFDRAARTGAPTLWTTGFSVKSNYRISEIRTEISDTWARKYALAYTAADNGIISLLNTVTESGQDESSTVTTLPAIDFDYQTLTKQWTYNSGWALPLPFFDGGDQGMRMADINGDSLPDVICHGGYTNGACGSNNATKVYLNTGSSWSNGSGWGTPAYFVNAQYGDTGLRIVDVNGDGLNDLALAKDGTSNSIYLNTGSGWTLNTSWTLPIAIIDSNAQDYGMRMADINGDGLIDIVCQGGFTNGTCGTANGTKTYLNNGSGWTNVTGWNAPAFVDSQYRDTGVRLVDVNADGLIDIVKAKGTSYNEVYINSGSGWTLNTSWSLPLPVIAGGGEDYGFRVADLNGEGFADILCQGGFTNGDCGTANPTVAYYNTATGWSQVGGWNMPPRQENQDKPEVFVSSSYVDQGLRLIDVDSNGLVDLVRGQGTNKFVYLHNTTKQVNFMTKVTYPEGGDTTITYKSSAQFKDGSNNLLNPNLPIIHTVVSQISDNDGTTSAAHNYTYEGGRYYFNTYLDRKFAGFAKVTDTDSAGNVKKTFYHQGNTTDTTNGEYDDHVSKIGKPYRVEEYDGSGNLYRLTVNKWDKYNIGTDHDFVKLVRATTLTYDGDSDHADTATEYSYDNTYGNLTTKTDWGKVTASTDGSFTDTGSDKATETISYVANTTNYVVGLPYQSTVVDQSANKVRESKTYYDTLSLGSVGAGNPTKVEQWVTGSTYINSQKAYNTTYGIVTSETDPRSKTTSYSYDSYNLYPTTVTNPLSQTTQYTYDYSLGKPKQVTDQNSFVYQTVYDGLDRVLEEKIPGFSSPYTPVTKIAYAYTDTANAVSVQKTDHLDGSTSALTYQYFDGLGRLIQERKEAESDYNVRDIAYNNRGLVLKESLPYTSSGTSKTTATGTTALYTNYTYDAVGRPATVVNALGTTSYSYDDWKTTVTDAESNVKSYYKDARDNLIQVDEVNGASTYTTTYEWNLNKKLTKITDALSNIRNFTYDGLGRRLTAEDLHAAADGTYGSWAYTYDDAGNLTQSVSPRSLTTNYTYNDINQQLTEDYTGAGGTEITYTYSGCTNGTGKLCSVSMASGANTSYTYNALGATASEAKTINSTAYTTSYFYDRQGNTLTITYPDSAEARYTFNTAGLLEKIERKESGGAYTDVVSNFNYNPVNQPTTISFPNTVTTTNTYDAAKMYRLTRRLTQNTAPTNLQDLNYTYDNVNNITQIVDASNTSGSKTVAYVYDDLNRLTSATATNVASGQSTYTHTYAYDALGNITSGPIGSYTYAGTNYANPHAATSINGVTFSYDNSGNLTGNGTLTNTWNYKDQLTQAVVGSVTSTYVYDHAGNRVSLANGTTTTVYPNKFYNTDGTKKTKQIYAGDTLVATIETVSSTVSPYYNHTNQLGSITAVSNASGTQVETLDYYPFGNQRISTGSYTGQRQYIGQIYDTDTGLDYLNARYYKGDIGRFISQDPVFLNPEGSGKEIFATFLSDPQLQNSYSYGRNNPITMSDPDGKWYKEFITGNQSWFDFSNEIAGATLYMGQGWQAAIDHPYVPAIVGAAPLIVYTAGIASIEVAGAIKASPKIGEIGVTGSRYISQAVKNSEFERTGGRCVFCKIKTEKIEGNLKANSDHSMPYSRGGSNTIENIQNTCRDCNLGKSNLTTQEFLNSSRAPSLGKQIINVVKNIISKLKNK